MTFKDPQYISSLLRRVEATFQQRARSTVTTVPLYSGCLLHWAPRWELTKCGDWGLFVTHGVTRTSVHNLPKDMQATVALHLDDLMDANERAGLAEDKKLAQLETSCLGFLAKYEEPSRPRKAFCSHCKSNDVPLEDWGTLASHTRRIPGTLSNEACPGSRKPSILSESWGNGV